MKSKNMSESYPLRFQRYILKPEDSIIGKSPPATWQRGIQFILRRLRNGQVSENRSVYTNHKRIRGNHRWEFYRQGYIFKDEEAYETDLSMQTGSTNRLCLNKIMSTASMTIAKCAAGCSSVTAKPSVRIVMLRMAGKSKTQRKTPT